MGHLLLRGGGNSEFADHIKQKLNIVCKQLWHKPVNPLSWSILISPLLNCQTKWEYCFPGRHLVVRVKLLNDAGVAAESPPSQHEQVFDLSQVIWSVRVKLRMKLQKKKFKWVCNTFSLISCIPFYGTWNSCRPHVVQERRQSVRRVLETEATLQLSLHHVGRRLNGQRLSHLKQKQAQVDFFKQWINFPLTPALSKNKRWIGLGLTWSPLLSACSFSIRKKEISFGGRTELKQNWKLIILKKLFPQKNIIFFF